MIAVKEAGADASAQAEILNDVSKYLREAKDAIDHLAKVRDEAVKMSSKEQAFYYKNEVVTAMEALRTPIDKLEMIVDKEVWPIPSYGDLMFEI